MVVVSASYAFAPKRPGLRCPLHCSGTHFGLVLLALVLTMGWCTALVLAMSMCCSGVTLVGAAPSTGVYYIFWLVLLHRCILWALAFVHTIGSTCIGAYYRLLQSSGVHLRLAQAMMAQARGEFLAF